MDYNGGDFPIYIGTAPSGSATDDEAWQIRKFTYDGNDNVTAIQYADTGASNQVWDDRASLIYS